MIFALAQSMSFNSIFPVTNDVIYDALALHSWIPSAIIFILGLIFTYFPRWRSSKTKRDKPVERHMASQFGVVLFVGIPLVLLSLFIALSSFNEKQILSASLKEGEIKYSQGTVAILSSREGHQKIMVDGHVFDTQRNSLPNTFNNGCPRKCKIRAGMVLEVAFLNDKIVGVREIIK